MCVYVSKRDLALDGLRQLICYKTNPNQTRQTLRVRVDLGVMAIKLDGKENYQDKTTKKM